MTAPVFVDTNVLVYFHDSRDPSKQKRAAEWLEALWEARAGRLSYQVIKEFYATVTQKLKPGLASTVARDRVRALESWGPLPVDGPMVEKAWALEDRYSLSWWDALIVAAAQSAGCATLLSEDLQHGQELAGVTVVDPFEVAPGDL